MATTGGNLLQRTRCVYFRDTAHACNKREPGTGCSAIDGHNRMLAILGTSKDCIATNPSDQNVALTALEATIQMQGTKGNAASRFTSFYLLPGSTPDRETVLEPGDLIISVTLAAAALRVRSRIYLKLRDRAAYEFALASAAIVLKLNGRQDRAGARRARWSWHQAMALASKPNMRSKASPSIAATFRRAAEAALKDAQPGKRKRIQSRTVEALPRPRTHHVHQQRLTPRNAANPEETATCCSVNSSTSYNPMRPAALMPPPT